MGFRTAADSTNDARAKALFVSRSQAIEAASTHLAAEVRRLGGDPEKGGSVAGAVHRGWIDLKSAVTGKSDEAVLAECERGEDFAVTRYEDALKKDLPPDVRTMVQHQHNGAIANRDAMRALKHHA